MYRSTHKFQRRVRTQIGKRLNVKHHRVNLWQRKFKCLIVEIGIGYIHHKTTCVYHTIKHYVSVSLNQYISTFRKYGHLVSITNHKLTHTFHRKVVGFKVYNSILGICCFGVEHQCIVINLWRFGVCTTICRQFIFYIYTAFAFVEGKQAGFSQIMYHQLSLHYIHTYTLSKLI